MKCLYLILLISFSANASTSAYFADLCSGEEIRISTPNGTTLRLNINDLNPHEDLTIYVKFRPAGVIEDLEDKPQSITHSYIVKKKKFKDGSFDSYFEIPKTRWMRQKESMHAHYRVWDAEIKWIQPLSHKSGSTITSFYRSQGQKSFFQLNSPGICQWEEEAEVDSRLFENNSTTFMNVVREDIKSWDRYDVRGFSLGYNNNHGGALPIGAQSSESYGWFFKDWQNQLNSQQLITLERRYVLNKEESGLFISRMSYNRHEVTKYEWDSTASRCGHFAAVSKGLLDVGVNSEDFIVIPRHIYSREEKLRSFINIVRPPVSNCIDSIDLTPQIANDMIPSGINGILYYYETNRSLK